MSQFTSRRLLAALLVVGLIGGTLPLSGGCGGDPSPANATTPPAPTTTPPATFVIGGALPD